MANSTKMMSKTMAGSNGFMRGSSQADRSTHHGDSQTKVTRAGSVLQPKLSGPDRREASNMSFDRGSMDKSKASLKTYTN